MSEASLGDKIVHWGYGQRDIRVILLIGSRARSADSPSCADTWSDWDFQIVTTDVQKFRNISWVKDTGLSPPLAYANRLGRLGHTNKISAVFPDGDLDLVLIPIWQLVALRYLYNFNLVGYMPRAREALRDLALILRAGHKMLKGGEGWASFFNNIARKASPRLLSDADIIELAGKYICDYISACSKVKRGEYLAAQRWLHVNLGEVSFRLLHEYNIRKGINSFPDARRIEMIRDNVIHESVSISALPNRASLLDALEKNAQAVRNLVRMLVGDDWKWPDLPLR